MDQIVVENIAESDDIAQSSTGIAGVDSSGIDRVAAGDVTVDCVLIGECEGNCIGCGEYSSVPSRISKEMGAIMLIVNRVGGGHISYEGSGRDQQFSECELGFDCNETAEEDECD